MITLGFLALTICFSQTALAQVASPITEITVDVSETSIYVGTITLTPSAFRRNGDQFEGTYKVWVFPAFFYNETGHVAVTLSQAALEALARGEVTQFTGDATNMDNKPRKISGRAVPDAPNSRTGKIKVRIQYSKRIELIFNTRYHFSGESELLGDARRH